VRRAGAFAPAAFVAVLSLALAWGLRAADRSPLWIAPLLGAFVFLAARAADRMMIQATEEIAKKLRLRDLDLAAAHPALDPIHVELLDIGAELRRREKELAEGEALLQAIVEMTPAAILLVSSGGVVLATNAAARTLFFGGEEVAGRAMLDLLGKAPVVLRRALAASGDELLVIDDPESAPHTHHLAKRYFELAGDDVVLVMLSDLSQEVSRQELDVYKRVIRVLSHEVNNSLAPITSLMHSARVLAANGSAERLTKVFETVTERAEHLRRFLDGYAELARLPLPRKAKVVWTDLFDRIADLFPGIGLGDPPAEPGWFDKTQMEQVLVNLLKNAEEAGSPRADIVFRAESGSETGTRIVVADRGAGMEPDVMKNALVPLFTTKEKGSGVGLAICREIVEAHGGTLRLGARAGGGLEVVVRLPPATRSKVRSLSGPLHRSRETK